MFDVYNGDAWSFPQLVKYSELLDMDEEYLDPNSMDSEIIDRYDLEETDEDAPTATKTLTTRELIEESLDLCKQKIRSGRKNMSLDDAYDAYNHCADVVMNKDASNADKAKAKRMMADAEQLIRDIERIAKKGGGRKSIGSDDVKRELRPTQQLWAHDTNEGSVESGATYQYRIRVVVYNALAGDATQFEDKEDATVVLIRDDQAWSDPSDPIAIVADEQYFVTAFDERKKTIRFELFKWFDGVWVTHRADLGEGMDVASDSRKCVPIRGEDADDRPLVHFDPGMTVVDIDFKRSTRDRKTKGGGVAIANSPVPTCSVVLADASGNLIERFVLTDKADPGKKTLAGVVYKCAKKR
jgi:hypothetical protein